ncbi:hypothetical protein AB0N19_39675, partial [Streptomyces sp. NPDC051132]
MVGRGEQPARSPAAASDAGAGTGGYAIVPHRLVQADQATCTADAGQGTGRPAGDALSPARRRRVAARDLLHQQHPCAVWVPASQSTTVQHRPPPSRCTVPADTPLATLVRTAKLRWRI